MDLSCLIPTIFRTLIPSTNNQTELKPTLQGRVNLSPQRQMEEKRNDEYIHIKILKVQRTKNDQPPVAVLIEMASKNKALAVESVEN